MSVPILEVDISEEKDFLAKHKLVKNNYLFYPAQFWAHKNHYNLILGFQDFLNNTSGNVHLVLTGSDQGNLNYIKGLIEDWGLSDKIHNLGFVSSKEVIYLYRNALSLIYPSFLGPSNLPLIEALYNNCFVLCSNLAGHKEMCQDAALYFDPEKASEISAAIAEIFGSDTQLRLASARDKWKLSNSYSAETAMKKLEKNFLELKSIRFCWQQ
jgi:glycosyltransferase involved in cell wall biosynthesis